MFVGGVGRSCQNQPSAMFLTLLSFLIRKLALDITSDLFLTVIFYPVMKTVKHDIALIILVHFSSDVWFTKVHGNRFNPLKFITLYR